jgi:hypothetical protein
MNKDDFVIGESTYSIIKAFKKSETTNCYMAIKIIKLFDEKSDEYID